tara:strand:- start:1823 stop:2305 length:483 start_codon:yes stop_codon:yes gene_type:complete
MSINEMNVDYFTTLAESKEWLQDNVEGGAICPCCERLDKVYNRKIGDATVRIIFALYKHSQQNVGSYFPIEAFVPDQKYGRDFPILRLIDLLERADNDDPTKKTSGQYRLTEKGANFARGLLAIPERLIIYHNELIGVSENNKFITEFWPNFNYQELMES